MELELPIYHYGEDTLKLAELELEVDLEDLELKPITFYNIDAIGCYFENDTEYSVVFAVGKEFLCPFNYAQLKDIVREAKEY
jgi:hypothetical protein